MPQEPFISANTWIIERPHVLVVACSDGRYQKPLDEFLREHLNIVDYDRMYVRMQSRKGKILMKLRQSTVEPVIGTLVNNLGIKRVNAKGLSQANKCLTMAAVAYNLKKMLKHKPRLVQDNIQSLKNGLKRLLGQICIELNFYMSLSTNDMGNPIFFD